MQVVKILIADDHQLVRQGIASMIADVAGMSVVGLVSTGEEAINAARELKPDVVLMDIRMPGMNGLEAARWIKEIDESVRVIIVSMEISKEYVTAAMSGVDGYLPKNISKETLIESIQAVHRGERCFIEAIEKLVFEDFYQEEKDRSGRPILPNKLTPRETEVLALVAAARSNRDIAEALHISVKTVETHKTHILMKLGLNSNAELARYAVKNNIISM